MRELIEAGNQAVAMFGNIGASGGQLWIKWIHFEEKGIFGLPSPAKIIDNAIDLLPDDPKSIINGLKEMALDAHHCRSCRALDGCWFVLRKNKAGERK